MVIQFSSSVVSNSLGRHGLPCFLDHHQLPELAQTHVHRVDAIQPSYPMSSPSPPAFNFPRIRVFSNESTLRFRWPKYNSFSFRISPSNKYSGLISFRMDWLDFLVVQETLKSLLQQTPQFKSISSLVLSFLYSPTLTSIHDYGKTIALARRTLLAK